MLRRFEGKSHADDYVHYRPTWPPAVFDTIVSYLQDGGGTTQLAVDVGCGTGISTKLLTERFKEVTGIDVSESMLSKAPKDIPNVTFRLGQGEDLSFLPDESVDAITCGASIHWLDVKKFYNEVDRVLKPSGILASFTYGGVHHLDNAEADQLVSLFYGDTLSAFFDKEATGLSDQYLHIEQPYDDFMRIPDLPLEKTWPLRDYLGYLSTISATRKLIDSGSEEFDHFSDHLLEIYKSGQPKEDKDKISAEDVMVTTKWTIKLNLSRKPK